MCYNCWEEAGKPAIITSKTNAAAKLVAEVYEFDSVGGHCHIVLDDFNIEDKDVDSCLKKILNEPDRERYTTDQVDIQKRCMAAFLLLTEAERASALALFEGWIENDNYKEMTS